MVAIVIVLDHRESVRNGIHSFYLNHHSECKRQKQQQQWLPRRNLVAPAPQRHCCTRNNTNTSKFLQHYDHAKDKANTNHDATTNRRNL
mmetsp:Transcript_2916/g.6137  ORF Transcript_2916/g.6137 Transcript_2916/m.6137 type:complete len:89 (-) Transcript_2916:26-292(-)